MNHFDLAQSFIERCASAAPVTELTAAFEGVLAQLGFRYFACCSHVNLLRPPSGAVVLHNYPNEWVQTFSDLKLYEIDPVFRYAERALLPFFWGSPDFRNELTLPQKQILAEAGRFNIVDGYTIPIHGPWGALRASCSVVPAMASIATQTYRAVDLMAPYLYEAAGHNQRPAGGRLQDALSRRELQCLELAAQGKTDWEVGKLLGISQWTVHRHIESAKRRLGVTTRVQAIVQALVTRQVSFGDVIRADHDVQALSGAKSNPRRSAVIKSPRLKKSPSDDQ